MHLFKTAAALTAWVCRWALLAMADRVRQTARLLRMKRVEGASRIKKEVGKRRSADDGCWDEGEAGCCGQKKAESKRCWVWVWSKYGCT